MFCFEEYFYCLRPRPRTILCKFRCSSHNLLIEQGRHMNIERMHRLWQNCNSNVIEDEYHFLLACPACRHLRIKYLKKYYYTWPSIHKFKLLLSTKSKNLIQNIAKYLDEAFKIRRQLLIY